MPYEIFYTEEAETDLLALPARAQRQIRKKMEGIENAYRLRSGDYRIIFERTGSVIVIFKISNRRMRMAKTKTRAAKPTRSRNGIQPVSSADARDLAVYLAAKGRDNGRRIPMAVVHRKAS